MARGDHLLVKRGFYTHQGIDVGRGLVIHFTGEPGRMKDAAIRRTRIKTFQNGDQMGVRQYVQRHDVEETVARAESMLGETGYDVLGSNCEHFATWCCTGVLWSEQVDTVGRHGTTGASLLVSLYPPARAVARGVAGVNWFVRELKALDRMKNYKDHWDL